MRKGGCSAISHTAYRGSGVDTDEAEAGLRRLVGRITRNWPPPGAFGAVQLDIGYFGSSARSSKITTKGVEIAQPRLIGHGTRFRPP
jgi:hypothetical protein